jgi:predicted nucleic acid-binding protein
MKQWLCDTNIISEEMRPSPDARVRAWLQQRDVIHLSAITVDEIIYGLHLRRMQKRILWFEEFIQERCTVLNVTTEIAQRAGKIRAELAQRGQTREQPDMLIAATTWSHGLILATRNTRDFEGTGIPTFNPFESGEAR